MWVNFPMSIEIVYSRHGFQLNYKIVFSKHDFTFFQNYNINSVLNT